MKTIIPAAAGSFAWCASVDPDQRPGIEDVHVWRTPVVGWMVDDEFDLLIGEPVYVEEITGGVHVLFPAGEGWFIGGDERTYGPPNAMENWVQSVLRRAQAAWDKKNPAD